MREYWTGRNEYGVKAGRRYENAATKREIEPKARKVRKAIDEPESKRLRRAKQIAK